MKRLLLLCLILGAACGGTTPNLSPSLELLEAIRERAEDHPNDPDAQRQLVFGEMLLEGGEAPRADAAIERALELSPRDERLLYLAGVQAEIHGQLGPALDRYLAAIDAAAVSTLAGAQDVAEIAATEIATLQDTAPRFAERVRPRVEAVLAGSAAIGPAARHLLGQTLIELAYRRGDAAYASTIATQLACVRQWRVAGPFGPRALLGFDEEHPARPGAPFGDSYDLGPGRGERATRTLHARGCSVHLGNGPIAEPGTTYAQTTIDVTTGGAHVLRLETPNAVEVFVDGRSIARHDARREPLGRVAFVPVTLETGRHEVTVKLASRHANPILVVSLSPRVEVGGSPDADEDVASFQRLAAINVLLARGQAVHARQGLDAAIASFGAAPLWSLLRAVAALSDPLIPGDVGRDEARRRLRAVVERDSNVWYAAFQLARLDQADGRTLEAITALRQAQARWPDIVSIHLGLAELLVARGWDAEAERAIARARIVAPDSCSPIGAALNAAIHRNRYQDVESLAAALVGCDARSDAVFQQRLRQRRWQDAGTELERIASFEPPQNQRTFDFARLEVQNGRSDDSAVATLLERLATEQPRSASHPLSIADRLLGRGQGTQAAHVLSRSMDREPAAMTSLHRVRRAIGGEDVMSPYRLDGEVILREFEASGQTYDAPQVLVLDYTVVRVFSDGSSLELTHNITRLQSEEAVDAQGEYHVPAGADMLTLRTIKADGTHLEPDEIEGKETISLTNLAVGDYVEVEYVRSAEPAPAFPGGFLGDRFYFQSFEVPFDRSELTIVLPADMEPVIEPRGPAPRTETQQGRDERVYHWLVRQSRPLVVEPLSVSMREFIPSINLGVRAGWQGFVDGLRDVLADRDLRDPAAVELVQEILGEHAESGPLLRAQTLYRWVLANIENNADAFGLAPAMLAQRTGSRARIFHYLLGIAAIRSDLVVVRSSAADSTDADLPDEDTYRYLLVMLTLDEGPPRFVWTVDRGAPFGYLPPGLRGQPGLVLAAGSRRVTTPLPQPGIDRHRIRIDVRVSPDHSARVDVREELNGAGAVSWRTDLEAIAPAMLEQRFEEAYVSRLVPGATMETLQITGQANPEEPLVMSYSFTVASLGRQASGHWLLPGLLPIRVASTHAAIATRSTTELIAQPIDREIEVRFHSTDGVSFAAPGRAVQLRGPQGSVFAMTAALEGSDLVIRRRLTLLPMRVAPSEYPELARFCRAVDEAEQQEVAIR